GSFERSVFPRLSGARSDPSLRIAPEYLRRAPRHGPGGGVGILELFLSLLRTLEHLAAPPVFRRPLDPRASDGVLSRGRIFRVAFHDGAFWIHVLEHG